MAESFESGFVAYVEGMYQLEGVSLEDGVKALVGYLATRDVGVLLQPIRSEVNRHIHAEGLNRFFSGQDFSAQAASQALRPLLERIIRQWVEQSQIRSLTANPFVGRTILPSNRDLRSLIDEFTQDQRLFSVQTDVGGDPPTLKDVVESYRQVQSDLNWAWQLSELYYVITREQENMPQYVATRLQWLNNIDLSKGSIPSDNPFLGVSPSDSHYPEPSARVLHASHSNPLETIIAVSAASTVMLIVSSIWAICKWKRSQTEADVAKAMAEGFTNIIDEIATAISSGNTYDIKKLEPIINTFAKNEVR